MAERAFTYYPGCSLHATAREFDASVRAVFKALDLSLVELEGWNCCGASSAHALNHELSLLLPARNLALAQASGRQMMMPCAACFNRHAAARHALATDPAQRRDLEDALGVSFEETVAVRPLLDIIAQEVGLPQVAARVRQPVENLKVVPYYGCLLVRPPEVTGFENPEFPTFMEDLLATLGATPCAWSYATVCCGGALSLTQPQVAARLVGKLVRRAREAGAAAIVTSCPLCQLNLEMRQNGQEEAMPIFYVTELMGLAFGLAEAPGWWRKHLIDPQPLLATLALSG